MFHMGEAKRKSGSKTKLVSEQQLISIARMLIQNFYLRGENINEKF